MLLDPDDTRQFIFQMIELVEGFDRVAPFGPYPAIDRAIEELKRAFARRDRAARDVLLARLFALLHNLRTIDAHDRRMRNRLLRELKRQTGHYEYLGIREEIATAAWLINLGVTFDKHEAPDFRIHHGGSKVFIECTSKHVPIPTSADLSYKIGAAIGEKGGKPYANPETAVIVDVTNVYFRSGNRLGPANELQVRAIARSHIEKTPLGSVLLASTHQVTPLYKVGVTNAGPSHLKEYPIAMAAQAYTRVDNIGVINPNLKSFLDQFAPIRLTSLTEYRTPDLS